MGIRKQSCADECTESMRMAIENYLATFDVNQRATATMVFRRCSANDLDKITDEELSKAYGEIHEIQMSYDNSENCLT